MNKQLILRALRGINSSTVGEFQSASGISSRNLAQQVLNGLASLGIGGFDPQRSQIRFSRPDRVRCAVMALDAGCDIEEVSSVLTWQDFEALASEVLRSFGYSIKRNLRFVKPKMEIDIVGVHSGIALSVDCKHWKNYSNSTIGKYCELQATRSERLFSIMEIKKAIPLIVTLHAPSCKFISGIPVVPVSQFGSFVSELAGNLELVRVIAKG